MTYNGWSNYETWLVNIWFDCWDFIDMADNGAFDGMDEDGVRSAMADYMSDVVHDYVEDVTNGASNDSSFISDVLNSFLREVDWRDLADHYIDDVMEAINNDG